MKKSVIILALLLSSSACKKETDVNIKKQIQMDAIEIAHKWTNAWNGEINLDSMMALHHKNLNYYWHGEPMIYSGFKDVLENYVVGVETYNNKLINPIVTVIDTNNAIVGFQLIGEGEDQKSAEGAFTLVITRVDSTWKIIHIHEG